jgi:hypothetical protein
LSKRFAFVAAMTTWVPACCAIRSQNDPLGHDEAPLGHQLRVRPDPS